MRITKARLMEIVKDVITEEAYDCEQDYRMGGMTYEEYKQCLKDAEREEGGYYEEGLTNEGSAPPELVKQWVVEFEDFIASQYQGGKGIPISKLPQEEFPAIVAALEQLVTKLGDMSSKRDMRERSEQGYRGPHKDIYDLGYSAGIKQDTDQDNEAFNKYQYGSPEGDAWKAGWEDGLADGGWH